MQKDETGILTEKIKILKKAMSETRRLLLLIEPTGNYAIRPAIKRLEEALDNT